MQNLGLHSDYYGIILFTFQSLLRGRFLRNNRSTEDERPTSVAASELGLLRQRRTVSGLRYYIYYALYLQQMMYSLLILTDDFFFLTLFLLILVVPFLVVLNDTFFPCFFLFFLIISSIILCKHVERGCFCVWELLVGGLVPNRKLYTVEHILKVRSEYK